MFTACFSPAFTDNGVEYNRVLFPSNSTTGDLRTIFAQKFHCPPRTNLLKPKPVMDYCTGKSLVDLKMICHIIHALSRASDKVSSGARSILSSVVKADVRPATSSRLTLLRPLKQASSKKKKEEKKHVIFTVHEISARNAS